MSLLTLARRVARLLKEHGERIVFAESCTAGLVAASLSRVPGISNHLCGSMVTYRNEEKEAWLGISAKLLRNPGPVSEIVAQKMVEGVVSRTKEATFAASVTGHLGPNAPAELDGIVFLGIGRPGKKPEVRRYLCQAKDRPARQKEVVEQVLLLVAEGLSQSIASR